MNSDMGVLTALVTVGGFMASLCIAGLWADYRARGQGGTSNPGTHSPAGPRLPRTPTIVVDPSKWSEKAMRNLRADLVAEDIEKRPPRVLRHFSPDVAEEGYSGPKYGKITSPTVYRDIDDVFERLGLRCEDDHHRGSAA